MDNDKKVNDPSNTEKKHDPVIISDAYLSQNCIEKCIIEFNKNLREGNNPILEIVARKPVVEIDPLLIAHLLLFKQGKPDLTIKFTFQAGTTDKLINRILQQRAQIQILTGDPLFTISGENRIDSINAKLFVWSQKFIPIILINKQNYIDLFVSSTKFLILKDEMNYETIAYDLYQNCRNYLYNKTKPGDNGLNNLAQLAFYNSLYESKILTLHIFSSMNKEQIISEKLLNANDISVGNLSSKIAVEFYNFTVSNIFNSLNHKPPIYHFIYSTLLSSDLLPSGQLKDDNYENFEKALINLWTFTNNLFNGLQELAKNIIEHTNTGTGAITGRVYKSEVLNELQENNPESKKLFSEYLNYIFKKNQNSETAFFVLNVIDDGNIGVIKKLKRDIEELPLPVQDDHDIKLINDNRIKFQHLLDSSEGIILHQQAKRALAHIGLLIFSKLIEKNEGIIRAGTWLSDESNNDRDNALVLPKNLEKTFHNNSAPLCHLGTNYNFILPLDPNISLASQESSKYELPSETSPVAIQSIENLLLYQVKDVATIKENELNGDNRYLFITIPRPTEILINKKDEEKFFNYTLADFTSELKKIISNGDSNKTSILCISFDNIEIDSSQLFRLLGKWELEFPGCPLIIYNIPTERVEKLILFNHNYCEYLKGKLTVPYWILNSLVIFYSYENVHSILLESLKFHRFYFTDALWGNERKDFLFVNHLIQKTNYNSTIMQTKADNDKELNETLADSALIETDIKLLSHFTLFQNGVSLLPFDLLLTATNGLSLFENNTAVLLQKELKNGKEVKR